MNAVTVDRSSVDAAWDSYLAADQAVLNARIVVAVALTWYVDEVDSGSERRAADQLETLRCRVAEYRAATAAREAAREKWLAAQRTPAMVVLGPADERYLIEAAS